MRDRRAVFVDRIERVARLAETVLVPGALHAARSMRPLSAASFRMVGALAEDGIDPDLVIDVGANRGQFAAAALHRWPTARVVSFEPLPAEAAALRRIGNSRLTVHEVALGASDGEVEIHPHRHSPSSSILPVACGPGGPGGDEELPQLRVAQRRLDGILGRHDVAGATLLKLDVQGYELAVLAGASGVLEAIEAIVVEQSFVASYEGQPLFVDVDRWLVEAGFRFVRPIDLHRMGGQLVEIDGLYRRSSVAS